MRHHELEEQCRHARNQPGPWTVYTDWLLDHGDVEGELAALRQNGKVTEAEQLFEAHAVAMGWSVDIARRVRQLSWTYGFLSSVGFRRHDERGDDFGSGLDHLTRDVLSLPCARFVDSIRFGPPGDLTNYGEYDGAGDWTATMEVVAASAQAPWMRELVFDYSDYDGVAGGAFSFAFGDFSAAWSRLPRLERLFIDSGASGRLGELELPSLRTFSFSSRFDIASEDVDSICDAHWPSLEYLELSFDCDSRYHGPDACRALDRILSGEALPALEHLRLHLWPRALFGDVIGALGRSAILPRLRSLELSTAPIDRAMIDAFVLHSAAFRHLDFIALTSNDLSTPAEFRASLCRALPNFRSDVPDSSESFDLSAP